MLHSRRRRNIDSAAELISDARLKIHFGTNIESAYRDARSAVEILARNSLLEGADSAISELAGESCLIIAMCCRLRGKHAQALKWLEGADRYLFKGGGWASSLTAEVLNTKSLTFLNMASQAASVPRGGELMSSAQRQWEFVSERIETLRPDGNHLAEAHNRRANALELVQGAQDSFLYLKYVKFETMTFDKSTHTRALTYLFMARSSLLAGEIDESWRYLQKAASLKVITHSNFLQIEYLEHQALFFGRQGDIARSLSLRQQAAQLRAIENIHETKK